MPTLSSSYRDGKGRNAERHARIRAAEMKRREAVVVMPYGNRYRVEDRDGRPVSAELHPTVRAGYEAAARYAGKTLREYVLAVEAEHGGTDFGVLTPAERAAPVPTKFWSKLFAPADRPNAVEVSLKADAMRNPVSDERWVDASWARWADLSNVVRHTFRSAEVVRLVNLGPSGCGWAALRDAMLAELGTHPFADRVREADRATA